MAIDESLKNDILKNSDIVKVIESFLPVVRKGKNVFAVCPFHDDTNPSLVISPEKQIFKCFVCGTTGTSISFVMKYKNVSYFEALKTVAEICGYDDPRLHQNSTVVKKDEKKETLLKCMKDLNLYYQYALSTEEGKEGLDYFENRHLDSNIRTKFMLGYAYRDGKATCKFLQEKGHSIKTIEDVGIASISSGGILQDRNQGRVIFPLCDENGQVIGFSARKISNTDEAKYVNTQDTYLFHKSKVLFNFHNAKEKARISRYVYVLEGFMDVIALARIGIDNAVAIMGTALTNEHISMLRSLNAEIRLCLDGDLPGQKAMISACKELSKAGLTYRVVYNINSSKDCDEILNAQGKEALQSYLNNLISYPEFALNFYQNSNPLTTLEQKKSLIKEFLPILLSLQSQLELDTYLRKLASITNFDVESIRDLLKKVKNSNNEPKDVIIKNFHPERKALKRLQIVEREMLYQMLNSKEAIEFYENNLMGFYDEIYRQVANYVVEFARNNIEVSLMDIISSLESSDFEDKDELINEISSLHFERKNHPNNCNQDYLASLMREIDIEKEKIFENDTLEQQLQGKTPLEKAKIIADYNKRKFGNNNYGN